MQMFQVIKKKGVGPLKIIIRDPKIPQYEMAYFYGAFWGLDGPFDWPFKTVFTVEKHLAVE